MRSLAPLLSLVGVVTLLLMVFAAAGLPAHEEAGSSPRPVARSAPRRPLDSPAAEAPAPELESAVAFSPLPQAELEPNEPPDLPDVDLRTQEPDQVLADGTKIFSVPFLVLQADGVWREQVGRVTITPLKLDPEVQVLDLVVDETQRVSPR